MTWEVRQGDALELLRETEADTVDCIVTSPPYWGLRDYQVDGQLGLEPHPQEYLEKLWAIFDEVQRVLKLTGCCWINLGDTYCSLKGTCYNPGGGENSLGEERKAAGVHPLNRGNKGEVPEVDRHWLRPKQLLLIPSRFAIGMQERNTMDIMELDAGFALCYTETIAEEAPHAIQGSREGTGISPTIREAVARDSQGAVSQADGRMAGQQSRQDSGLSAAVLLGEPGEGNQSVHSGKREKAPRTAVGGIGPIWRKSTDLRLLWRTEDTISVSAPHTGEWGAAQGGDTALRFDLRVAEEGELPSRLRDFVHELQLRHRSLWLLPPSGRRNLCIRRRDVPAGLESVFSLRERCSWILRNDIAWSKPNAMPSSVKDRFSCTWEHVFLFVKHPRYWFELDAVREPHSEPKRSGTKENRLMKKGGDGRSHAGWDYDQRIYNALGKNPGDVWRIPSFAFEKAHFATYPPALVRRCLRGGCPAKVCAECGKPWRNVVEATKEYAPFVRPIRPAAKSVSVYIKEQREAMGMSRHQLAAHFPSATGGLTGLVWNWEHALMLPSPAAYRQLKALLDLDERFDVLLTESQSGGGWVPEGVDVNIEGNRKSGASLTAQWRIVGTEPTCACAAATRPGLVLDPFVGSGTTGLVAVEEGRRFLGFDLKEEYCEMARRRIAQAQPPLMEVQQ